MEKWPYIVIPCLGAFLLYAIYMYYFVRRLFDNNLHYMTRPSPNIWARCQAAARYDAINIRRWEVTFMAIFFLPLKLIMCLSLTIPVYSWVWIWKTLYCGISPPFNH